MPNRRLVKGYKSLVKREMPLSATNRLDSIIKGSRLGIMEWNHNSSPVDAPETVVCGYNISRRKKRTKHRRNRRCFMKL